MKRLIKVAAYIRMSSEAQDKSPEQQRAELQAFANQHGYQVVEWYSDEAKSGDNTVKRDDFRRMIADASTKRFEVIICWNGDRFSRLDSIEGGKWVQELRNSEIRLHTIVDGMVDWETMGGRIVYQIQQEMRNKFLSDLSENVMRSHRYNQQKGVWTTGRPPFGYSVDKETRKLLFGNKKDVRAVREMFSRYAQGYSLREIARWLQSKGYKTRTGKDWTASSVKTVLGNEIYCGHLIFGRKTSSRFAPGNKAGKTIELPRDQWTIHENVHEAIITPEMWGTVQDRLESNRHRFTAPKSKRRYAFTGLVRCGHCGGKMGGHPQQRSNKRVYACNGYSEGRGECGCRRVGEHDLLSEVCYQLRVQLFDRFLSEGAMEQVRERMRTLLSETNQDYARARGDREKRVADLQLEFDNAIEGVAATSLDLRHHVEARARKIEGELEQAKDELAALVAPPKDQLQGIEDRIQRATQWLDDLEHLADTSDDFGAIHRLLTLFIVRVDVFTEKGPEKHELTGGRIYFNSDIFPQWAMPGMVEFQAEKPVHIFQKMYTGSDAPICLEWGNLAA